MIEPNTVLILGAGASVDYDYPLGKQIRDKILAELREQNELFNRIIDAGFTRSDIENFRLNFRNSRRNTIDEFLYDQHINGKDELSRLGKFLIAHIFITYENEDKLMGKDTWYGELSNGIMTPVRPAVEQLKESNISICSV